MPARGKVPKKRDASKKGDTIKKHDTYDALLKKGYDQEKAARIANAQANGTLDYHSGRGGKRKSKAKGRKGK